MSVERELLRMPNQTAELSQAFDLEPGEEYEITVVASNAVGNSSESNALLSVAPSTAALIDNDLVPLVYIPVAVVGAAIAIIVLLVIAFVLGYRYRSELHCNRMFVGTKLLHTMLITKFMTL